MSNRNLFFVGVFVATAATTCMTGCNGNTNPAPHVEGEHHDDHDHADTDHNHTDAPDHESGAASNDHGHDLDGAHIDDDHDHDNSDSGHDHDDQERHHDEGIVSLTPAELEEFGIQIATAGPQSMDVTTSLSGEVVLNPDAVAHVVARASGIAQIVHHTIGDSVQPGEPLADLESPALAEAKAEYLSRVRARRLAQTDLARAETVYTNTRQLLEFLNDSPGLEGLREFADLDLGANRNALVSAYAELLAAEAAYTREQSLFEKQIGSEAEYLQAESLYKQAQAAFLSVRDDLAFSNERTLDQRRRQTKVAEVAQLAAERTLHALGLSESEVAQVPEQSDVELARYVIEAPIAGVITERHIVRGEHLHEGADLFTVADLSTVWVELTVYQKDLPVIQVGQPVRITASYNVAEDVGTIAYVNPIIDEATRSTTARIVLQNDDRTWLPGMFVNGAVELGRSDATVVVPRDAIQSIDGHPVIFIQQHDGFEAVEVTLGRGDRRRVAIISGLRSGQRYAATNTFTLKSELGRAALEHAGHVH